MLHVEPEQIDLVLGESADLRLQIIKRRDGAAADVIAHASPFHARPVADGERRDAERLSSRVLPDAATGAASALRRTVLARVRPATITPESVDANHIALLSSQSAAELIDVSLPAIRGSSADCGSVNAAERDVSVGFRRSGHAIRSTASSPSDLESPSAAFRPRCDLHVADQEWLVVGLTTILPSPYELLSAPAKL